MTVSSLAPDWGTANVVQDADQQDVRCDSSAVIQAVANYGYHFTGWSNGSMANPDTLKIDRDSVLTASFAKNTYYVEVSRPDQNIGSVSGGGVYEYLDTVVLTATAVAPYHFDCWSDGNRENPRTMTITQNIILQAMFEITPYTVTAIGAYGGGSYTLGSTATLMALPQVNGQFAGWSDGETANPRTLVVIGCFLLSFVVVKTE